MSAGKKLDFANPSHFDSVRLIHDTVMGGQSDGAIEQLSDPAGLRFYGNLSLANNGGFASAEFQLAEALPPLAFKSIQLNIVGDGRKYLLRLKTPALPRGAAYVAKFETSSDNAEYNFQPSAFVSQYRGRRLTNMPPLNFADVNQISLMLADKNSGSFSIALYSIQISS
jgi:hypothetical protein